jgi:hypothetical protein
MNSFQTITKNLLLAFILITIGFSLGKEVTLRTIKPVAQGDETGTGNKVIVYYLHATFRCATCNTIEKMSYELLNSKFGEQLKTGLIEWKQANFQKDEALAKKYQVISSCVVVVQIREGKETAFKRLDEVWTLMEDKAAFDKYVGDAIMELLNTKEPGGRP